MALNNLSRFVNRSPFVQTSRYFGYIRRELFPRTSSPALRVDKPDPLQHTRDDIGKFYTPSKSIYDDVMTSIFKTGHKTLMKTFQDHSILIRAPALEVIESMKQFDPKFPAIRYLLYGDNGVGTSVQLAHIANYTAERNWFIFNFQRMHVMLVHCPDIVKSEQNPELYDTPTFSEQWLKQFYNTNRRLLEEAKPCLTQKVQWNVKEFADVGTSWADLINFGINRTKYATDCIGILLREVRNQSTDLPHSALLMFDGVNTLFSSSKLSDNNTNIPMNKIALFHYFLKSVRSPWSNGAIVLSVNQKAGFTNEPSDYKPKYLLSEEGFKHLEPFIPIEVPNYTREEAQNVLRWFVQNGFITNESAMERDSLGQEEILTVTACNPQELENVVNEW